MRVLCESHPAFAAHDAGSGHPEHPAVCAAMLAADGERVVIVDWDAHHGNGTQDAFWNDPRVLYVSMHQWPLYPGTGRLTETGEGQGVGLPWADGRRPWLLMGAVWRSSRVAPTWWP